MRGPKRFSNFHHAGFTLVELAIVLVIIGLIIGGVLAGRSLIEAAALRSTLNQLSSFKSAVTVFRIKYNAMPGDMMPAQAAQFGMLTRPGGAGSGNGNGIINDYLFDTPANVRYDAWAFSVLFGGENHLFWTDLSSAGLIGNSFTNSSTGALTAANVSTVLPPAKLGRNAYFRILFINLGNGPQNFYNLQAISCIGCTTAGKPAMENPLTPVEAFDIDTKIDDGNPLTGKVMPSDAYLTDSFAFSQLLTVSAVLETGTNANNCMTGPLYSTANGFAETHQCGMMFSF